ncbi:MAG: hypothetical protein ACREL5_02705 [Gemmatimonadales bacterium]
MRKGLGLTLQRQRAIVAFVGAVIAGTACSTASVPTALDGQWGGENIWLYDSLPAKAVVVVFPCNAAMFDSPIRIDDESQFTAVGWIIRSSWPPAVGTPVQISGMIAGRGLSLALSVRDTMTHGWQRPENFSLIAGQQPHLLDNACTV